MKKIKLSTKAVLSLGLSAVLFCMPAVGFALNGNYAVNVHAEDSKEQEAVSEEPAESTGQTEADTEQSAEGGTEESTENTTEESTEILSMKRRLRYRQKQSRCRNRSRMMFWIFLKGN